jgi:probable rRNA maturation factor
MIKTNFAVRFHFLSPCPLSKRKALKAFIASIFKKEKIAIQKIDIIYCNDEYLLALNKRFLKHDFYTDILSFPLSEPNEPLVAEIYVSIDRVKENADNLNISFKNELHRVIFHGILHFCGYKDKSNPDIKAMRKLEDKYLRSYFKSTNQDANKPTNQGMNRKTKS